MTNTMLPLNAHTFAAIIALEYLTHAADHSEFAPNDDQSLAEILADDLDDLYHNANFEIFTAYFFDTPADDIDANAADDETLYEMLSNDETITDIAAAIITTAMTRDDPFAAFR